MTTRARKEYVKNKLDVITVTDKNNKTTSSLKLSQSIKATRLYRLKQLHDKVTNANHPFSQIKLSQRIGFFPIPCDDSLKKTKIIYDVFLHIFTHKNELENIDMRSCNFKQEELLVLFKLVKSDLLKYLDISNMDISHELAILLSQIIRNAHDLKGFKFTDTICSSEDFCMLLESIKYTYAIDHFIYDVASKNIKECDHHVVAKIINESTNIKSLEIRLNTAMNKNYPPNMKALELCRHIITDNKTIKTVRIIKAVSKDRYADYSSFVLHKSIHDDLCLILDLLKYNNVIERFELEYGVGFFHDCNGSSEMMTKVHMLYHYNGIITLFGFPNAYRIRTIMMGMQPPWTRDDVENYQHLYQNFNERNRINNIRRNKLLLTTTYKHIKHFRPQWLDNEETAARKRAKRAEYNKRKRQEHKAKLARIQ